MAMFVFNINMEEKLQIFIKGYLDTVSKVNKESIFQVNNCKFRLICENRGANVVVYQAQNWKKREK